MSETEINITIVFIMSKDERDETQNEYSIFFIEMRYIRPHLDIQKIGIHGKNRMYTQHIKRRIPNAENIYSIHYKLING